MEKDEAMTVAARESRAANRVKRTVDNRALVRALEHERHKRGLLISQFTEGANFSQAAYSEWRSDHSVVPSSDILQSLATAYNLDFSKLLGLLKVEVTEN